MRKGGGGETYLKSEDWDGNENWRYRQTDSTAIQIEVLRYCTPQHGMSASLFSMPCLVEPLFETNSVESGVPGHHSN